MSEFWHHLMVPELSIVEKIVRPILVYVFLILGLRLAGKRELAQLNPFDLIVLLLLSNTVQNAIIGNDNSVGGGMIGAITLLVVNYIVVRFLYGHEQLESLLEGKPDELIANGKIQQEHLKREQLTVAGLETAAHRQGFASLEDIDRAVLETCGTISFFPKQPVPDVARHSEVIARLDRLADELASLRTAISH